MKYNCRKMLSIVHQSVSPEEAKVMGFEQTLTLTLLLTHWLMAPASVLICKTGIIIVFILSSCLEN